MGKSDSRDEKGRERGRAGREPGRKERREEGYWGSEELTREGAR